MVPHTTRGRKPKGSEAASLELDAAIISAAFPMHAGTAKPGVSCGVVVCRMGGGVSAR